MPTLRIFGANFLKFVRTEDYTNEQTDYNRLYFDQSHPNTLIKPFVTKLQRSDSAFIQFRTDYSDFTVYLYNSAGSYVNISSLVSLVYDIGDGRKVYNITLSPSSLNDYYYILITTNQPYWPVLTFRSEWFWVKETHSNCLQIKWSTSEQAGIIWGSNYQYLRVNSRLSVYEPASEKYSYTDTTGSLKMVNSFPQKVKVWQCEPMPDFEVEKLNIALGCEYFYINGIRFTIEDKLEVKQVENTSLYEVNVKLREVGYEDYTSDPELTGTPPTIEPFNMLVKDAGDKLLINDSNDKLLISS